LRGSVTRNRLAICDQYDVGPSARVDVVMDMAAFVGAASGSSRSGDPDVAAEGRSHKCEIALSNKSSTTTRAAIAKFEHAPPSFLRR